VYYLYTWQSTCVHTLNVCHTYVHILVNAFTKNPIALVAKLNRINRKNVAPGCHWHAVVRRPCMCLEFGEDACAAGPWSMLADDLMVDLA
jgi:hypothetical protein